MIDVTATRLFVCIFVVPVCCRIGCKIDILHTYLAVRKQLFDATWNDRPRRRTYQKQFNFNRLAFCEMFSLNQWMIPCIFVLIALVYLSTKARSKRECYTV